MDPADLHLSRRALLAGTALAAVRGENARAAVTEVDIQKLVSRAGLRYTHPPPRSEEGIPVCNGRMGSLVSIAWRRKVEREVDP
jgi:hypothetical protein